MAIVSLAVNENGGRYLALLERAGAARSSADRVRGSRLRTALPVVTCAPAISHPRKRIQRGCMRG